jgi:Bacterial RNA polymerase, alpha chain C terminal domain
MPDSPYPREGQRLAPVSLSDLLDVPVPPRLLGGAVNEQINFADLDESSWTRFGPACLRLARALVERVGHCISSLPAAVRNRAIPPLPNEIQIEDLELEQRTYNRLWTMQDHGGPHDVHDLGSKTIGELLDIRGFGAKCLVDLLTSIESVLRTPRHPPGLGVSRTREAAAEPQCLTDIGIRCSMLSSSKMNRKWRLPLLPDGSTVHDLRLRVRTYNCLERLGLHKNLRNLENYTLGELFELPGFGKECVTDLLGAFSESFPGIALRPVSPPERPPAPEVVLEESHSLEEELYHLAARAANVGRSSPKDRNVVLALRHFGLDGACGATLAELGMTHNLTRERIRQICKRIEEGMKSWAGALPFLERALTTVKELLPSSADLVEAKLQDLGVTQVSFRLEALATTARLLGRKAPFALETIGGKRIAVQLGRGKEMRRTLILARRAIAHYGAATTSEVAAMVQERTSQPTTTEFIAGIMQHLAEFEWLDKESGWFWIRSTRKNRIASRIRKILAVADKIHVSELRSGIARHNRMNGYAPPRRVLLELCRRLQYCMVEGDYVRAEPKMDWRQVLRRTECTMVQVLMEHGPVMQRAKFEEICVGRGMKKSTFYVYLDYSPVIERFARGVFGLRGAAVDPGTIQSLIPSNQRRSAVRLDHGWTADRKIWIGYHLSEAMLTTGVFSIPGGLKSFLQGSFALKAADGNPVGTVVIKEVAGWGIGPFFRCRGGEPGDTVVIVFDLKTREARLSIGGDELIDEQQRPDDVSEQLG